MRMRKKRHGSERVQALSSLYYKGEGEIWSDIDKFYYKEQPLALEIGCGKGDFITGLSARDTEYNYIAVEKIADVSVCAAEKYARSRNLGDMAPNGGWKAPDGQIYKDGAAWDIPLERRGNVRFVVDDAMNVLSHLPDGCVSVIYANFSDPWPKKGYENRRLTSPAFLKEYVRVLSDGGRFVFKTDNDGLFEYSLETVDASPLKLVYKTFDLHASDRAEGNIMTEYERNFSDKGVKIKMLEAVKTAEE